MIFLGSEEEETTGTREDKHRFDKQNHYFFANLLIGGCQGDKQNKWMRFKHLVHVFQSSFKGLLLISIYGQSR